MHCYFYSWTLEQEYFHSIFTHFSLIIIKSVCGLSVNFSLFIYQEV